jgi:hypothetical protein
MLNRSQIEDFVDVIGEALGVDTLDNDGFYAACIKLRAFLEAQGVECSSEPIKPAEGDPGAFDAAHARVWGE